MNNLQQKIVSILQRMTHTIRLDREHEAHADAIIRLIRKEIESHPGTSQLAIVEWLATGRWPK